MQNPKILLADDDRDDIELLIEALQTVLPAAEYFSVTDGVAVSKHLSTHSPDLVFLDLNMPLKNGLHCLRDIFNLNLLPGKPIVIYSTSNNSKDIDEAYKHNAAYYIIKPASFKSLCEIVKLVLNKVFEPGVRVAKEDFVVSEPAQLNRKVPPDMM